MAFTMGATSLVPGVDSHGKRAGDTNRKGVSIESGRGALDVILKDFPHSKDHRGEKAETRLEVMISLV